MEQASERVLKINPEFRNLAIFIRQSSDGTYYGMEMSVWVSVWLSGSPSGSPSVTVFRTFLLHAVTYWADILYVTLI